MRSFQYCVDEVNRLLDQLIEVATRLRDTSRQSLLEEELMPLQQQQDELLAALETVDLQMQSTYRDLLTASFEEHVHRQLQAFQTLNQEFIQNVQTGHGLIHFELHRPPEEEGTTVSSFFSRLKKSLPSPNDSQTVTSKEDKQG